MQVVRLLTCATLGKRRGAMRERAPATRHHYLQSFAYVYKKEEKPYDFKIS